MMYTPFTAAAAAFAAEAHAAVGQVRKYTKDPYIIHPAAVASLVATAGGDEAMIAAAFLHDTIEDTQVAEEQIADVFGEDVASLVDWLSDKSKPEDGNRATRKAMDRERLSRAPVRAKVIKIADIIDNSQSITKHDPDFAVVYMREKELLLEVLGPDVMEHPAGRILFAMAAEIMKDWYLARQAGIQP